MQKRKKQMKFTYEIQPSQKALNGKIYVIDYLIKKALEKTGD
ncbi:hypothetical protein [Aneurinibacillus aneurinilyticus]|nr:hypothetical protein [Aneurinibacillus aneurinilyticus]MED0705263.1 hypothetical protein [Aneurinibacillus aneurinilyticus]MED0722489.1 hypothetical protein [Aneurinibacillus aneurinilyticus]MED0733799.1 hypothetical protein [Aneurinibacillus aneurinilyticus]MED0739680.1 hypothetical protein [Aneurinibacillus aneurinilyticus]